MIGNVSKKSVQALFFLSLSFSDKAKAWFSGQRRLRYFWK